MNKKLLLLLLLSFKIVLASAQNLFLKDIPVLKGLDTLKYAWVGGLNTPQFSEIDLNNDGTEDLMVYDRSSQRILTFLNAGRPGVVDYNFAPEYMANFPQNNRNFVLAKDYNCDGIKDLFVYNQPLFTSGGVGVLKGYYDSNNRIAFQWVSPILKYNSIFGLNDIFIFNPDVPGIEDIDGDGDIDIASFTLDFTFSRNIFFYKNLSVERGFSCDSLIFNLEHECFGMVSETPFNNNTYYLSPGIDSCADNPYWRSSALNPRHSGSSLTLIDWNKDDEMDMLIGDVSIRTMNLLTSNKVNDTIISISQDSAYPSYNQPVNIFTFPSAYFIDVDNDNDKDMLACPTELSLGEAVTDSVVWFYENLSSNAVNLDFVQKDFMVGEMIDLGMNANPALVDVNGDGLLDIISGHFAYTDTFRTYRTSLAYYQNIGTSTNPVFSLQSSDYAGLSTLDTRGLYPTFGDIDNDGDQDMLLGTLGGDLILLTNTAGFGNNMSWSTPQLNYKGIDVGDFSTPQLVDINRDGDLDLMIGNYIGRLYYYQNTGTASSANFSSTPTSNTFGFDLNSYGSGVSAPHFYDNDGSFELFLGHENGTIIQLGDIDGNITGIYDTLNLNFGNIFVGKNSRLAIADIDNDDSLDFVVGNICGGLTFYSTKFVAPITSIDNLPEPYSTQIILTNPVRERIRFLNNYYLQSEYVIFNLNGQVLKEGVLNSNEVDVNDLESGLYFISLKNNGKTEAHKFSVIK